MAHRTVMAGNAKGGSPVVAKSLLVSDYRPLSELVCERLRDAICQGRFKPGERLIQEELASRMGVSRMPVREALHRLAKEGLVEWQPHRGAVVRRPVAREFKETAQALVVLERAALELAIQRISDSEIADLERVQAALKRSVASGRVTDLVSLNRRFHRGLIAACGIRTLCDYIDTLKAMYWPAIRSAMSRRSSAALVEHDRMLSALRTRNLDELLAASQEHLMNCTRELVSRAPGEAEPSDGRAAG